MDHATGENHEEQNLYQPADALAPNASQQSSSPAPDVPVVTPDAIYAPAMEPTHEASVRHSEGGAITWTASEFIDHQKTGSWYAMLGIASVMVAALVWLVTRDFFPTTAVFIGVLLLGAYATQKPRQQTYTLDGHGLTIGSRHYAYADFRSFSLVVDGAFVSVELTPMKRFSTYVSMYFDPADEDRILQQLSRFVPMEDRQASLTDSMMRRLHF